MRGNEKACPICRKENYDFKNFTRGQLRFLQRIVVKMQGLVRGFIQRNKFYKGMKDTGYKPRTDVIRKRYIGYKLGRISKKWIDNMTQERREMLEFIKHVDKNIESTEKLLESFLPNLSKMMANNHEKKLIAKKQMQNAENKILSEFW